MFNLVFALIYLAMAFIAFFVNKDKIHKGDEFYYFLIIANIYLVQV